MVLAQEQGLGGLGESGGSGRLWGALEGLGLLGPSQLIPHSTAELSLTPVGGKAAGAEELLTLLH